MASMKFAKAYKDKTTERMFQVQSMCLISTRVGADVRVELELALEPLGSRYEYSIRRPIQKLVRVADANLVWEVITDALESLPEIVEIAPGCEPHESPLESPSDTPTDSAGTPAPPESVPDPGLTIHSESSSPEEPSHPSPECTEAAQETQNRSEESQS